MRRRALLTSIGVVVGGAAGCVSDGDDPDSTTTSETQTTTTSTSETTTDDAGIDAPDGSDADLIQVPLEKLLLERSDFKNPEQWIATETNTTGRTQFIRADEQGDEEPTSVTAIVHRFDSVSPAKQKFDDLETRANAYVGVTPQPIGIGVEGLGYILADTSVVVFRDANVVAEVTYRTSTTLETEATVAKAETYAKRLYRDWR